MSIIRYLSPSCGKAQAAKPSTPPRHPYAAVVLVVTVAGLCVFIVEWLVGVAPLIILGGAAVVCLTVLGVRPGLLALLLSALAGDFFFVEPVLTFTRHSFLLAAYYSVAAVVSRYVTRKPIHR